MAKIKVSKRWEEIAHADKFDALMAVASQEGLLHYLVTCAKADLARKPWGNKQLSTRYKRFKQRMGGAGIADLNLRGTLRREILTDAPRRVRMKVKPIPRAETWLSVSVVPYAAAHQYGYAAGNLPERRYIRLEENRKKIARQIRHWLIRRLSGTATG